MKRKADGVMSARLWPTLREQRAVTSRDVSHDVQAIMRGAESYYGLSLRRAQFEHEVDLPSADQVADTEASK